MLPKDDLDLRSVLDPFGLRVATCSTLCGDAVKAAAVTLDDFESRENS